jgi:hypothetical protein
MQVGTAELTYCTNIHSAEGWPAVFENLRRYALELKARLSPHASFGLGLRLSNEEAEALSRDDQLEEFAKFLQTSGLHVALINGFPYGWFHGRRLKDQVFAPDWTRSERVDYTIRLIRILSRLLPDGMDGGVSTCPLSYKPWFRSPQDVNWDLIIGNLLRVFEVLFELKRTRGQDIHLDIEPEPDGLIENTSEFVAFFDRLLQTAVPRLREDRFQLESHQAERALREHFALCYDLCHSAVEFENGEAALERLKAARIRIGRVQISSAVKMALPADEKGRAEIRKQLQGLVDPVYLHQVIGDSSRFPDLEDSLAHLETEKGSEWRIHYHVPVFLESYGVLSSTQAELRDALHRLIPTGVKHFEIETYTWSVLPAELKLELVDSIEREYRWVLDHLR